MIDNFDQSEDYKKQLERDLKAKPAILPIVREEDELEDDFSVEQSIRKRQNPSKINKVMELSSYVDESVVNFNSAKSSTSRKI